MRELAEIYQSQIIAGPEEGTRPRQVRKSGEDLSLDTTVLSIKESVTEPITLEAFINEKPEEKCLAEVAAKEESYCVIETNAEVHNTDVRPAGKNKARKNQDKTVEALGKSDIGCLFEDEEKVCLATTRKTTSGGSKKKTSSRPEVRGGWPEAG